MHKRLTGGFAEPRAISAEGAADGLAVWHDDCAKNSSSKVVMPLSAASSLA
jgi:hypothetical protein